MLTQIMTGRWHTVPFEQHGPYTEDLRLGVGGPNRVNKHLLPKVHKRLHPRFELSHLFSISRLVYATQIRLSLMSSRGNPSGRSASRQKGKQSVQDNKPQENPHNTRSSRAGKISGADVPEDHQDGMDVEISDVLRECIFSDAAERTANN